jgi:WD40 repeat protein
MSPSYELMFTMRGHTGDVNCVVALPDGRIASGSNDKTIKLWQINGTLEATLKEQTPVLCLAVVRFELAAEQHVHVRTAAATQHTPTPPPLPSTPFADAELRHHHRQRHSPVSPLLRRPSLFRSERFEPFALHRFASVHPIALHCHSSRPTNCTALQ